MLITMFREVAKQVWRRVRGENQDKKTGQNFQATLLGLSNTWRVIGLEEIPLPGIQRASHRSPVDGLGALRGANRHRDQGTNHQEEGNK